MASWYDSQLTNRNYLSPIGFVFLLHKARKVSFLCQRAEIPTLSISEIVVPTPGFVQLPIPDGQPTYANLNIEFVVDENLENYMQIHNWMRAISTPEEYAERFEWIDDKSLDKNQNTDTARTFVSDATLQVLNNNNVANFDVTFKDAFPVALSSLPFDVTSGDNAYFTATATFRYTLYEVRDVNSSDRR
tara:strand:+ start:127 stop:693 length:567 start_codon:yes stop_codon:yes gene_type:complete